MVMFGSIAFIPSPIGVLQIEADETALLSLKILPLGSLPNATVTTPILEQAIEQLQAYFKGELRHFTLPITPLASPRGATLRAGICQIPYGVTSTYGALAAKHASAARAIGQACRTNPLPIVVPCHRVISSAGPEFYSGGEGPRTKAWLIDFEYENLPWADRTRLL
jgi:methylated-DNA-[protein]-cysteine S-methyltransferase